MSVYRDKERNRWIFEFDTRINKRRIRVRKILPEAWTRAKAEAYDRIQSEKLYDQAHNGTRTVYSIDDAVSKYMDHRCPELKRGGATAKELLQVAWAYEGKPLTSLPDVCREIVRDGKEIREKTGKALSPATVRNRIRYLTAACRYAWMHHGMGEADPAARVHVPQVKNERQVYATRIQMIRLVRACKNWHVRAVIRIAFYSGMRRDEILRAEIVDGVFVLHDTKNGEPRHVPVHPKLRSCLWIYPVAFSASQVVKHWTLARAAVGMTHMHFHDLRHSAASEMINADIDLYTVGTVLGHKDSRSTQRYAHLSIKALATAIGKIGAKKVA